MLWKKVTLYNFWIFHCVWFSKLFDNVYGLVSAELSMLHFLLWLLLFHSWYNSTSVQSYFAGIMDFFKKPAACYCMSCNSIFCQLHAVVCCSFIHHILKQVAMCNNVLLSLLPLQPSHPWVEVQCCNAWCLCNHSSQQLWSAPFQLLAQCRLQNHQLVKVRRSWFCCNSIGLFIF